MVWIGGDDDDSGESFDLTLYSREVPPLSQSFCSCGAPAMKQRKEERRQEKERERLERKAARKREPLRGLLGLLS